MVNKAKTTPRVFKLREWNIGNYLQRCCKHWKSKGGSETWTKLPHHRSSLVAQTVKNPPAVQGTWIRSLGQEDPWQPTPVFFLGEFHGQRSLVGCSPWGCKESDTTESLSLTHTHTHTHTHLLSWSSSLFQLTVQILGLVSLHITWANCI